MNYLDLLNTSKQHGANKQPRANQQIITIDKATNKPSKYSKSGLTPAKKKFVEVYARTDNGVKAVTEAFPGRNLTYGSKATTANRLLKNVEVVNHIEYQKNKLERLATKAVKKVEQLIDSDNEQIATTNVWKTIEQVQGKAVQKSTSVNFNFTEHVNNKGSDYGQL